MIIIFGLRRLKKGMGPILLRCNNCGASPLALLRVSTWFALFFIPLIPVSFKHYTVCPNCKRLDGVSKATVESAQAHVASLGAQPHAARSGLPATLEHAVNEWAADRGVAPANAEAVPTLAPPSGPPAAGWYPDPAGATAQRYWDGQGWTEHTAPTTS